jgi:VanZ family protein
LFEFLEKRKIWLVYIPLGTYWIVLFIATSLPINQLPSIGISDKINHFLAFFILAILLNLTLTFQRKNYFLFDHASILTIAVCFLYGAFDEIHQMWVPGRYSELLDWLADGIGALAGVLFINFLMNNLRYKREFSRELN